MPSAVKKPLWCGVGDGAQTSTGWEQLSQAVALSRDWGAWWEWDWQEARKEHSRFSALVRVETTGRSTEAMSGEAGGREAQSPEGPLRPEGAPPNS